jgi:mono/diheme cytochrome c family protein
MNLSKIDRTHAQPQVPALKRRKVFTVTISIILLMMTGLANNPEKDSNENQDQLPTNPIVGRIVFEEKGCINCHAIDGFGGTIGPDLVREKYYGSFYDLASRLLNHAPQMAIRADLLEQKWPTLTGTETDQLISYLFYLRYLGEPGNISIGKELIQSKGCVNCHRIGNEGAEEGISLDQLTEFASPLYIAQVIWNHGPAMHERILEMGFQRPVFENGDIIHISAYLREFSRGRTSERQFMSPGNPQNGATLFLDKGCGNCHALDDGKSSLGPKLSEMNLRISVTDIAGTMWNHGNAMWEAMKNEGVEWPIFKNAEMADVIAYLYFFDYLGNPGNPIDGEKAFLANACANCHSPGENFEFDESIKTGKPSDMVSTMWNHVPYMHEIMTKINVPWPELSPKDLSDLYSFLH